WAYKSGAAMATELDYVPLPEAVVNQIRTTWKQSVKDGSGKALY
ncbi:phosphate ABC transporter substrate-binding protein PstS, partial [Klebsiella quasipneumoniae]|nr:phosphate ABC transporter substrate-binding protein PstS [Klebsiella quasipneumoniae]